jgi:aspartyl-tRNA synthetase
MQSPIRHTCGELRLADAGERVKLVGWMENVREVGSNFAFVSCATSTAPRSSSWRPRRCSRRQGDQQGVHHQRQGSVRERASKNPKLPTGEIEVVPEKIEVLGRCRYNELPFPINRSREADEATRLKYRYLDLRNPAVKKNIILRCKSSPRCARP